MSLLQSNLQKQIRKLPKILKSVKIIKYYSILFNRVLSRAQRRLQGVDLARADRLPRLQQVPGHALGAGRRRQGAVPLVVALHDRLRELRVEVQSGAACVGSNSTTSI